MSQQEPIEKTLEITNKYGLHARASTRLSQVAQGFKSTVKLSLVSDPEAREVDVKSVLGILSMGAEHGETVRIVVEGEDAPRALEAIVDIFERKFDEE